MKKILTLLLLMITIQMSATNPIRVLLRSNNPPQLSSPLYTLTTVYIKNSGSGTSGGIYVTIAGNKYSGTVTMSQGMTDLSIIFPNSAFQYTFPNNTQYAVIGSGSTGLRQSQTASVFSAPYLFYDLYNFTTSETFVAYHANGSGYYYWFMDYTISDLPTTSVPTLNADGTLLASDQFSFSTFSVYPNPTSSMLNIDSDKEFSASIYDLTGKKLLNFSTKTFDISQLASGIYYLDIILEDKRYTKKIIKQ